MGCLLAGMVSAGVTAGIGVLMEKAGGKNQKPEGQRELEQALVPEPAAVPVPPLDAGKE